MSLNLNKFNKNKRLLTKQHWLLKRVKFKRKK